MTNEFGRRRPPGKGSAAKPPEDVQPPEEGQDFADRLFSPLMGKLAAVVGGIVVIIVLVSFQTSNMRGMGRALNDEWAKKTIGPVDDTEPDLARLERRPCEVVSLNPKFREVQRQLGC